jgi:hypothetical protein
MTTLRDIAFTTDTTKRYCFCRGGRDNAALLMENEAECNGLVFLYSAIRQSRI